MTKTFTAFAILSTLMLTAFNATARTSRYGDCFERSAEKQGKRWDPTTVAGAYSKGCSFRHDQSNSERINHERALQQCVDKYGRSNNLYWACKEAVDSF